MEEYINEIDPYVEMVTEFAIKYGLKILGAIVVLVVGLWIIKMINKSVAKMMRKRELDPSLQPFLRSLISALLKVLLVITVMSMMGVEMTSFVAILGAAGLAVGLALSGTLQNFAGGVMLLVLRPFRVGDLIEVQGFLGVVKEIQIFHTVLNTLDNKRVIIPNNGLSTDSIINYSIEAHRRVDFSFGISYSDDVEKAKSIVQSIAAGDDRIIKEGDKAPFVRLGEMGDSSINLTTRFWVKTDDYWPVYFDTNEKVYEQFNAQGISIPFPQMDVHLFKNDN